MPTNKGKTIMAINDTGTPTAAQISGYKSRIFSLNRIGAVRSVAKIKAEALAVIADVPESNRQWVADQWYGRCSKTPFETLLKDLT
jgi:hypothetical protein